MSDSRRLVAYQDAVQQVREKLEEILNRIWRGIGSYRDADVDRLVALVVPHVQAGQVRVARLTSAYFRVVGERAGVDVASILGARGVPPADVYRRPAVSVWTGLAEGKSVSDAVESGRARLLSLAMTDLQMAKVRQARRSLESAGVKAYRRVLTGRENCALCVIASTQRYWVSDLSPIHPGCDCTVDVLPPGFDPSQQVFDPDLLELTHDSIEREVGGTDRGARELGLGKTGPGGKRLSDYTDLLIVRDHGEYGPTLAWRSQHFTSKADIPALN